MEKIDLKALGAPLVERIAKEWMLVTAGTADEWNTMTASWGGVGWLWNRPVAFVFVRPERSTHSRSTQHYSRDYVQPRACVRRNLRFVPAKVLILHYT